MRKHIISALAAGVLAMALIMPFVAPMSASGASAASVPTSVEVVEESVTLKLGQEPLQLTVNVLPADAEAYITWIADDPNVVAVDNLNRLHPIREGRTTLRMTSETSGHTDSLTVFVEPADELTVEDIALDKESYAGKVGETFYLTPIVYPSGAESESYSWRCSDTRVAIVNSGTVMLIGEGECTVTVTEATGQYSATCHITVTAAEPEAPEGGSSLGCGSMISAAQFGMGALLCGAAAVAVCIFKRRRDRS